MALSWILRDDKVTSVLIGASKPEQILDNIKIIGHTDFTEEELQKIETIVQGWHWSTKMGLYKKQSHFFIYHAHDPTNAIVTFVL